MIEILLWGLVGWVLLRFLLQWLSGLLVLGHGLLGLIAAAVSGFAALLPRLVRFAFRPLVVAILLAAWLRRRVVAGTG